MRINLDFAIEDPEKWLSLELSGINKTFEGEISQEECKVDLMPPESTSLEIEENYSHLFYVKSRSIRNLENYIRNQEPKDETIKPLAKRKIKPLENESQNIIEEAID
ncbi:hypothetical protein O181_005126 [Austropuccinia psidii MF-1]|uniref:Uncharacterized protein n=1 Tax=Austropuccinia psidii MF-1 TaxID=1389203 RepID=A0A9Q3BI98_9BASI|nr:hypothetical protein [Austropuccinia psidii MF-1]